NGDPDQSYQETLIVEFQPIANFGNSLDKMLHNIKNRYGASIQIDSFSTEYLDSGTITSNSPPNNIYLTLGFKAIQFEDISGQPLPDIINFSNSANHTEYSVTWTEVNGAQSYDFEWSWIDTYGNPSASLNEEAFKLNSTRINTKETQYTIPNIYGEGKIYCRVRAISRFSNDYKTNYYGPWSNLTFMNVSPHGLDKKNWQFQASYAENGKKKEVVSYFDGTLRNRQT